MGFRTTAHRLGDDDIAPTQGLADVAATVIEQVKGVLAEHWNTASEMAVAALPSAIPAPVTRGGGRHPPPPHAP